MTAVVRLINFLKLLPSLSLISYLGSIANYRLKDCDSGILSKQPEVLRLLGRAVDPLE